VDSKPVPLSELSVMLQKRVAANANLPVYITGASDATHGSMVYVLDFVKRAGVSRVAIAVKAAPGTEGQP
jgi:biopolymer transport protein ExbD